MEQKKISVVIPSKNKPFHLKVVLNALASQIDANAEVVVVLDGCSREVIDEVRGFELPFFPVVVINKNNLGRAATRNRGIRAASGDIIVFLDDDAVPCADFIEKHRRAHEERCILQGELKDLSEKHGSIKTLFPWKEELYASPMFNSAHSALFPKIMVFLRKLTGSLVNRTSFTSRNASALKEDLVEVGCFDEKFDGWGYEDVDLGYRLCKMGIPFKRDFSLDSYHIPHPVNPFSKDEEELKNIRYLLAKIKGDFVATWVTLLYYYTRKWFRKVRG